MLSTDPVGRLLTADGDLDISAGRARFASGLTGFVQGANARIQLIRGEHFLDRTIGIAYVENDYVTADQALIGQRFDEPKARREFTRAIAATPGFGALLSMLITFDRATRGMTVAWSAQTAFGIASATVEI